MEVNEVVVDTKRIAVLRILVLGLLLTAAAHGAEHGQGTEGHSRPGTAETGSQDTWKKIALFAEIKGSLEVTALGSSFKLTFEDRSTKFLKWISAVEKAHEKIYKDCQDKAAGPQLEKLMKAYASALAEETSKATTNKSPIQGADANAKSMQVERLFSLTSGVKALLETQFAKTPEDKQARVKAQNESLLSMMDKTNEFLAGIQAGDSSAQTREQRRDKVNSWALEAVSESGLKPTEAPKDNLRAIIDSAEEGALCWFDGNSSPSNNTQGGSPFTAETGSTGNPSTEKGTGTEDKSKPGTASADGANSGGGGNGGGAGTAEYGSGNSNNGLYGAGGYGTGSYGAGGYGAGGYGSGAYGGSGYGLNGYGAGGYGTGAYDAAGLGYGGGLGSLGYGGLGYGGLGGLNYTPSQFPYVPHNPGDYKVSAPPPAAAAAAPFAPFPITGSGYGSSFGGSFPGYIPPSAPQIPFFPPPSPPPPPLVPLAQRQDTTTTEERIPVAPPAPVPVPPTLPPPPQPPTVVNQVNALIRIRKPDGTEQLVPANQIPAGATLVTSPNPNTGPISGGIGNGTTTGTGTGTTTQNVNSILGR